MISILFLLVESDAIDENDLAITVNGGKSKRCSKGTLPPQKRRKPTGIPLGQAKIMDFFCSKPNTNNHDTHLQLINLAHEKSDNKY